MYHVSFLPLAAPPPHTQVVVTEIECLTNTVLTLNTQKLHKKAASETFKKGRGNRPEETKQDGL